MKVYTIVFSVLFAFNSFGQTSVFDTKSIRPPNDNFGWYSKTNFFLVDTIQLWNYLLDTAYHGTQLDSIKPIGLLVFWRTKPIDDSLSKFVYKQLWTPYISFDIFDIANSVYCFDISKRTRFYSSCVPPDVGGDIIIIGKYLFLNHSVCISCGRYDTKVDYCRPVINLVFSKVDKNKITSIESLVQQFIIARGELPKADR